MGGQAYKISDIGLTKQMVTSETNANIRVAGGLTEGTYVSPLEVEAELSNGIYQGQIVVETVNPITFIIN